MLARSCTSIWWASAVSLWASAASLVHHQCGHRLRRSCTSVWASAVYQPVSYCRLARAPAYGGHRLRRSCTTSVGIGCVARAHQCGHRLYTNLYRTVGSLVHQHMVGIGCVARAPSVWASAASLVHHQCGHRLRRSSVWASAVYQPVSYCRLARAPSYSGHRLRRSCTTSVGIGCVARVPPLWASAGHVTD